MSHLKSHVFICASVIPWQGKRYISESSANETEKILLLLFYFPHDLRKYTSTWELVKISKTYLLLPDGTVLQKQTAWFTEAENNLFLIKGSSFIDKRLSIFFQLSIFNIIITKHTLQLILKKKKKQKETTLISSLPCLCRSLFIFSQKTLLISEWL